MVAAIVVLDVVHAEGGEPLCILMLVPQGPVVCVGVDPGAALLRLGPCSLTQNKGGHLLRPCVGVDAKLEAARVDVIPESPEAAGVKAGVGLRETAMGLQGFHNNPSSGSGGLPHPALTVWPSKPMLVRVLPHAHPSHARRGNG